MNQKYLSVSALLEDNKFKEVLKDARKKAKDWEKELSREALVKVEKELKKDINSKGATVQEIKLSLGNFRGYSFVTSAKISIKVPESKAEKLLDYLKDAYSSKFKLKSYADGVAKYNVR